MMIEQAIFTSVRTGRNDGYQVAASSPGVTAEQKRELSHWGPAHDSLEEGRLSAISFFGLQDGNFCIAKTSLAGAEYSGRGGERVYTQCLIVPPETMERFANHPFRVLEAVIASGRIRLLDPIPAELEAFKLVGRASPANSSLLSVITRELGSDRLATVCSAAISTMALAVISPLPPERLFAAALDLLPPPCRLEFPFSTGLRFSPRRPFRWLAVSTGNEHRRRLERVAQLTVLDLCEEAPTRYLPEYGWPLLIWELLKKSRFTDIGQVMRIAQKVGDENFDELAERLRDQVLRGEPLTADPSPARRPPSGRGTPRKDSGYRAARTKLRDGIEH